MADAAILAVVVGARLLVPLLIARFPVPAILACLVIDAADQTVFEQHTSLDLAEYQTYDKALDVYYLTLAYVATIRNWAGGPDFLVGQVLWYYRLVGVALFEATSARWMLLVFPNTFEYYFIAIELYRVCRDPNRLALRQVAGVAAVIWVVIKLPQEWWIHVAQLDVTDAAKQHLFGVDVDSAWWPALTNRPIVTVVLALGAIGAVLAGRAATRLLPPREWAPTFDTDRQAEHMGWRAPRRINRPRAFFGWTFVEKVVLVSLVAFIFGRMLPGADSSLAAMVLVTAYLIAANTLLSQWLAGRGTSWSNTITETAVMAAANLAVLVVTAWIVPRVGTDTPLATTVFLVGLLTLIVVLYDRFQGVFADQQRQRVATPQPVATAREATS